mmetsp:Transcript_3552/g.10095  ORF Transcript_3552/g.10095 Transcript_3552/m.10095 type:complete len:927 (+) Transcript_3552:105-2885(+)
MDSISLPRSAADPCKPKHHPLTIALALLSILTSTSLTLRLGTDCGGTQVWGWPLSTACGLGGVATIIASTLLAYVVGLSIKGQDSADSDEQGSSDGRNQSISRRPASELTEPLLPHGDTCSGSACEDLSSSSSSPSDGGDDSSSATSSSSSSSSYSDFGQPDLLNLDEAKKIARVDHSLAIWREAILLISYIILTGLSFVLGVEAVDLGQGDLMGGTNASPVTLADVGYIAALLASLQLSYFAWKWILTGEQTSPKNLLDLRAVHVHPIRYSVERFDAYCDVCSEGIKNGECFRCVVCDFDYCLHCFRRGKRNQDWAVLRGDKGVKVSEGATRKAGTMAYLCRSLELLLHHIFFVILTAVCLLTNVVCQLFVPNIEGHLFDDLIGENMSSFMHGVKFLGVYWAGCTLFEAVQRYSSRLISRRLRLDLRRKLFARLLSQDIAFFDSTRSGAMARRIDGDVEDMSRPIPILVNNVLQSSVLIVGALICCLVSSARLTVLSAACIGPVAYLTYVSSHWGGNLEGQMIACEEEGSAVITEAMANIRNVRALSAEDIEEARYAKILSRLRTKMHIDALGDIVIEILEGGLEFLVEVLVLAFGGMAIVGAHPDALTVGELIAFTMYWDMLRDGVQRIQDVFSDLAQAAGAAQRVFDLLDIHPDIPLQSGVELSQENFCGDIQFANVAFSYQSRPNHPVLEDFDLHIPAGGTVALVGKSGEGKSSLIHLLLRMYDPQRGCITVDGIDLKEVNLKTFHWLIGYVSQDTKLIFGTVRDNLTYGLPLTATNGEIEEAARAANCLEFIEDMDDRFDTHLGEGGIKLSGGQRQRLAIARAFLRKPRLLIMDEASSHLDSENERLVQEGIDNLIARQGHTCTVIIIAHRLSTVKHADIIAVLQNGKVVEQGSHETLLEREEGVYAKLVAKQGAKAANVI